MGLLDARQRDAAAASQRRIVDLIAAGNWTTPYDSSATVECFLNRPEVKAALGVPKGVAFESCSAAVEEVLGPDVMKSVVDLVPDLLAAFPLLRYQGLHDIQDGPPSSAAWIDALDWEGREAFYKAERRVVWRSEVEGVRRALPLPMGGAWDNAAAY